MTPPQKPFSAIHFAKTGIIVFIAAAASALTFSLPPIPQPQAYLNFADTRTWLGIPNFGDVVSNIAFVVVGVLGLRRLSIYWKDTNRFADPKEAIPFLIAFTGLILVGPGSAYFHWAPSNESLVWDRLPISLVIMAFLSTIIAERIHLKTGLFLLPILLLAGIISVVYWGVTESAGRGDLRPYILTLFLPILVIPVLLLLFPPRYTGVPIIVEILIGYGVARVFEHYDHWVFEMTNGAISGHSAKHLVMAWAAWGYVRYMRSRMRI